MLVIAEGLPCCRVKANPPGVIVKVGMPAVGLSNGVLVIIGVRVAIGVLVTCWPLIVGVQEGIRVKRRVTVAVGAPMDGIKVGGGNGLRLLDGSTKIRKKTERTQKIVTSTRMVRTFHTNAVDVFERAGLDSGKS